MPASAYEDFRFKIVAVTFMTDFADQAVLLPLALVIGLLLAVMGWRRGALAWCVGVGGTLMTMLGLKLVFAACTMATADAALRSPSGHAAAAAAIYGGLFGLLARRGWRGALAGGIGVATLIGLTRVWLDAHTPAESLLGGMVGSAGAVALVLMAGDPPGDLRPARLIAATLAVAILAHGAHLRAEPHIRDFGQRFAWLVPLCSD